MVGESNRAGKGRNRMVKISNTEAQHLMGMIQEWRNEELVEEITPLLTRILVADKFFSIVEFLLETHEDAD